MTDAQSTTRSQVRRALVTGAAGDIGFAVVDLFARDGMRVAMLDRDAPGLARRREELAVEDPAQLLTVTADVTDARAVTDAVNSVGERLGGLDVLVVNAGLMSRKPMAETDTDEIQLMLDVHVLGVWRTVATALPYLRRGEDPAIITMSSAAGLNPASKTGPAYRIAKSALIALSKVLAHELLGDGVRVNCIAPGAVSAGMARAYSAAELEAMTRGSLGRRAATADDVAQAVHWAQAPASGYMTGQIINLSGGAVIS